MEANNLFRFPISEPNIVDNESIVDLIGDEDELDDHGGGSSDQSITEDENDQNNDDANASQASSIRVTTSSVVAPKKKLVVHIQDEFLSDEDDQQSIIQPETRSLTLINLLERTFILLKRCRQLVSDMRNIGVVDAYISIEIGTKGRGVALDMEVNFSFSFCMMLRERKCELCLYTRFLLFLFFRVHHNESSESLCDREVREMK